MFSLRHAVVATTIAASLHTAAVQAQDEERSYDASISLGYVATSGNTETTTFNLEVLYTKRTENWTHNLKLQGLGSQENNVTRAERYYFENKSDYALDADQYLFGKGTYTDDRFSGFEYQASVSTGYGRYLLRRDTFNVQGFVGAGYRENSIIDGPNDGEGILTLGQSADWRISDNSRLTQSYTSEIGEELTVSRFEIGLESNIIDRLATKIAFQARNTSRAPEGNEKTDTQTSVSLVYTF